MNYFSPLRIAAQQYLSAVVRGIKGRTEVLPLHVRKFAAFADNAYKDPEHRHKALSDMLPSEMSVDDYEYLDEYSNEYVAAYLEKPSDTIITSIRGTKINDANDLTADALLAVGHEKYSKRALAVENDMERILENFPDHYHVLAGHSLGGSLNLHLANRFKDRIHEIHNFNPGASISQVREDLNHSLLHKPVHDNLYTYHIEGDAISGATRGATHDKTTVYGMKKGSVNPHSIHQFIE